MKKILLLFLVGLLLIVPTGVSAVSYHSYGVTEEEKQLMAEDSRPHDNIFSKLYYRMVEKDTKDAVDYMILAVIIVLMVLVIVALNKKTYVIPGNIAVFEEEQIDSSKEELAQKDE